jgi:ATP-dependent helicase/nuclease subunit A
VTSHDELVRRDLAARRAAQTEFAIPLVLEAGAGTGKTSTLVARIVAWSLNTGWERASQSLGNAGARAVATRVLERVVAITFTEAAASEMAARVLQAFGELAQGREPLGVDPRLLPANAQDRSAALLEISDRLTICTIHAYCQRLLRRFPLVSEGLPGFEVDANGARRAAVLRSLLEQRMAEAYQEPVAPELLELASYGIGPHEIEAELETFFESGGRAAALAADPLSPTRVAEWRRDAKDLLLALRKHGLEPLLGGAKPGTPTAVTAEALLELEPALTSDSDPLGSQIASQIGSWEKRIFDRISAWSRGKFIRVDRASLGDASEAFAAAARRFKTWLGGARRFDPELLATARSILFPLAVEAEAEFRREGIQSFDGMLRDAESLLRDHPATRQVVQRAIDLFLVDEFQDTDQTQCELVKQIALCGRSSDRPSLFVVGDPKQSIYGWRNADLAAYEDCLRAIEQEGGRRHVLHRCFRSRPQLLDQIERWMRPCMQPEPGIQPAFEPLVATREPAPGQSCVEAWIDWLPSEVDDTPRKRLAGELATAEAQAIAGDLIERQDELQWSDVGILLRSRGELDRYLDALREAGIPFRVEGDRAYYRRREIIELSALVRCILDPADHISLLAWLRSIHVGIPDAALIPLWSREFPARMTALDAPDPQPLEALETCLREAAASLPADAPGLERIQDWEVLAYDAVVTLAELRWSFWHEAGDVFVEKLRQLTLAEATEASRYLGRHRLANVERFLRELESELCGDVHDTESLLRNLRRRLRRADPEEEARPTEDFENAVSVCTIHQAKGLEFDHVYLAQTHKASAKTEVRAEPGKLDTHWEYALFGAETPRFAQVNEVRTATARAELVRTLYVAMTRARERLVLLGNWPFDPDAKSAPSDANHHAALLSARDFGQARPEALFSADPSSATVSDGVTWLFADAFPSTLGKPTGMPIASDEFTSTAADAAAVERARESARLRQLQPLSIAATAVAGPKVEMTSAGGGRDGTSIGTAVHRALERLDWSLSPEILREAARSTAEATLAQLSPSDPEAARSRLHRLIDRFFDSDLGLRRLEIGEQAACEVPALLDAGALRADAASQVSGSIDLLYTDPDTGDWDVVDYKTDSVTSEAELDGLSRKYAHQGWVYATAVKRALGLDEMPRFELWLLDSGRIVEVAPVHSAPL